MDSTGEDVLLNSRTFSPCAIIAAFEAKNSSPRNAEAADMGTETFQDRSERMPPIEATSKGDLKGLRQKTSED